ncbi:hypothetical protein COI_0097 [Mannheimia haemolytica serotype A2 str. OVINE]|nr:hypothetical protein COI_0097 [Mannheimia haemolytica serotype A2 str. OVINE]EEY13892.1 hypothetical protein COK_0004 [Mannheimia haemolytica serotype A2 str. BOVINE]
MDVSTHRVSPEYHSSVFAVCIGLVIRDGPLAETVLYPRRCPLKALPK